MKKILKTKIGFTLVEMLVVVVILSIILAIGIPVFRGVGKSNRIKACCTYQRTIATSAKEWCIDNNYNEEYTFTVVSSPEEETGYVADDKGEAFTNENDTKLLRDSVLGGRVPHCAAGGTYTIKVIPQITGTPKIEVTCDGGNDGDCHKPD